MSIADVRKIIAKLRKAHELEIEAIHDFYSLYVSGEEVSKVVEEVKKPVKPNVETVNEQKPEEQSKIEINEELLNIEEMKPVSLPNGFTAIKVPANVLKQKKNSRIIFCRDCHKRITDEPHELGNNLWVCGSCFKKRNSK